MYIYYFTHVPELFILLVTITLTFIKFHHTSNFINTLTNFANKAAQNYEV